MKTTIDLIHELEKVQKDKQKGSDELADYLLSAGHVTFKWPGQNGTCFEVFYNNHYYNLIPNLPYGVNYIVRCNQ